MHTHTHIYIYIHTYICRHTNTCTHTHTIYIYIYIDIYIYMAFISLSRLWICIRILTQARLEKVAIALRLGISFDTGIIRIKLNKMLYYLRNSSSKTRHSTMVGGMNSEFSFF